MATDEDLKRNCKLIAEQLSNPKQWKREYAEEHEDVEAEDVGAHEWLEDALKMASLQTRGSGGQKKYSDAQLLEWLRQFYGENNRVPTQSDFSRGYLPPQSVYINRFGNLNEARMAAGIPVLIPLGGRRFVESMEYQKAGAL